jgi:hypothetical protein
MYFTNTCADAPYQISNAGVGPRLGLDKNVLNTNLVKNQNRDLSYEIINHGRIEANHSVSLLGKS